MFYIDCLGNNNTYGVIDTADSVREFYTEAQLRSFGVEILGVYDTCILPVRPAYVLVNWFKCGDYEHVIEYMPLYVSFILQFRGKPSGGEMCFVNNYEFILRRTDEDKYSLSDEKQRKYFTLSKKDVIDKLEWYFRNTTIKSCIFKE